MAVLKSKPPIVGFRYEVNIIPEVNPQKVSFSNAGSFVTSAVSLAGDAGFTEVSGISVTLESDEIETGDGDYIALPKIKKYTPLILKRGLTGAQSELMSWVAETILAENGKISVITKAVVVKLLNEHGEPMAYWLFTGAYPTKWAVSGLKAMTNELVIEELEIKYKAFFPVFLE